MNPRPERPLAPGVQWAYAAPAFALAVVGIPVYVYIPKFYADVIGLNMAMMGTLIFGVRLFDAVTDPVIGALSDATRTRWGRRKPFITVGAPLLALALALLFVPPRAAPEVMTLWFGATIYALFLCWTLVTVPYESLGPELTQDYHQRTSLFVLRDGLLIAGTLTAAVSPALIEALAGLDSGPEGQRRKFMWLAVMYAPLLVATCWWCAIRVKENASRAAQARLPGGSWRRGVAQNRPFLVLLGAYTVSAVGGNLPATLILFYVQYVLRSPHADLFLILYFFTGIVMLPLWVAVSKRIGKKHAWIAAMTVNTGAFAGVFFLGPGDILAYGVLVVLSGMGFGATLALPSSIQADVIDYDELLSGRRREGLYIGLWSVSKKLAAAAGVGAGLGLLGAAGYTPNVEQSDRVLLALRSLYALVPAVCNVAGILIVMAYPIGDLQHSRIRDAIAQRRAGRCVKDPLTGRELQPLVVPDVDPEAGLHGQADDACAAPGRLRPVTGCMC